MKTYITFLAILLVGCGKDSYIGKALDTIEPDYVSCSVMRVMKGDQFYCRTTNQNVLKVRLMGVEIDRTKEGDAKEFTKSLLPLRSNVWVSIEDYTREDKGVYAAFVFLQDKTFLNGYLIREGYAYESFKGPEAEYKNKFDEIYYKEEYNSDQNKELDSGGNEKTPPWLR